MMKNDGGSAFPPSWRNAERDGMGGMTLRDYFATHSPEIIPNEATAEYWEAAMGRKCPDDAVGKMQWWHELEAKQRYARADAMLAERSK